MVHAFVVLFAVSLVAVTSGLEALLDFVVCLSIRPVHRIVGLGLLP